MLSLKHWKFLKLPFFFFFFTAHFDDKHSDMHNINIKDFHVSRLVFLILLFCIMLIINPFPLPFHANDYLLFSICKKLFCVQIKLVNLSGPYILQIFKTWHLSIFENYICLYIRRWETHGVFHCRCFWVYQSVVSWIFSS